MTAFVQFFWDKSACPRERGRYLSLYPKPRTEICVICVICGYLASVSLTCAQSADIYSCPFASIRGWPLSALFCVHLRLVCFLRPFAVAFALSCSIRKVNTHELTTS